MGQMFSTNSRQAGSQTFAATERRGTRIYALSLFTPAPGASHPTKNTAPHRTGPSTPSDSGRGSFYAVHMEHIAGWRTEVGRNDRTGNLAIALILRHEDNTQSALWLEADEMRDLIGELTDRALVLPPPTAEPRFRRS